MLLQPAFEDRADAGKRLAAELAADPPDNPLILALPRGGVPVAAEIARSLGADIELLMVRKLGAPGYPEYGVGAVVDGSDPQTVLNEDVVAQLHPSPEYLEQEKLRQLGEIERRRKRYMGDRTPTPVTGRNVIVVDDGIATGGTVRAALVALRRGGAASITIAVPVASARMVQQLTAEADNVVCLLQPDNFKAVGLHYRDFTQVEDDEVEAIMAAPKTTG